jgi:hypothetical protein
LFLHDGHGDLGEVVHHQVVDRAALHLPDGRLQPVAPEPLAGGDSDDWRTHRLAAASEGMKAVSRVHT